MYFWNKWKNDLSIFRKSNINVLKMSTVAIIIAVELLPIYAVPYGSEMSNKCFKNEIWSDKNAFL